MNWPTQITGESLLQGRGSCKRSARESHFRSGRSSRRCWGQSLHHTRRGRHRRLFTGMATAPPPARDRRQTEPGKSARSGAPRPPGMSPPALIPGTRQPPLSSPPAPTPWASTPSSSPRLRPLALLIRGGARRIQALGGAPNALNLASGNITVAPGASAEIVAKLNGTNGLTFSGRHVTFPAAT